MEAKTNFTTIYDSFLNKITDDLYVELTPEDTLRDLQNLLLQAIPCFEFPRKDLNNYVIETTIVDEENLTEADFSMGKIFNNDPNISQYLVEKSYFNNVLTAEEINILAILMFVGWVQRQVASIENTRMKYSGSDFKMTSQANHLQKLLSLLGEAQRQSHHMQRLYKRRRLINNPATGETLYRSNWDVFDYGVYY